MSFKMGVSKEQIEGREVLQPGVYDVRFIGFSPAFSKPAEGKQPSLNLKAKMEIINNPDLVNRFVFDNLNMGCWYLADFCHAFGLPMEQEKDADGEDKYYIPGTWDSDPAFDSEKAETYKYKGPLTGKTGKLELAVGSYNNKPKNEIRRYFCAIDSCDSLYPQVKHSTDLLKKA